MSSLPQAPRGDHAALSASSLTISALAVTGFMVVLGVLVMARVAVSGAAHDEWTSTEPAPAGDLASDPSRYVLHAVLLPALDTRTSPARWIDARSTMGCRPGTSMLVNGEALRAGADVPITPFTLEWKSHGCRPFGPRGPKFDGHLRMTVFHEDWGFSAMVEPVRMRVTLADGHAVSVAHSGAVMPADDIETARRLRDSAPPR